MQFPAHLSASQFTKNINKFEKDKTASIVWVTAKNIMEADMFTKSGKHEKIFKEARVVVQILLVAALVAWGGVGIAGESEEEVLEVTTSTLEVQLAGVTEHRIVQLFAYLMEKATSAVEVQPVSLRIAADDPRRCRAQWQVIVRDSSDADFIWQLNDIINDLDPEKQNTVLYESPFIVTNGDVEQVKKIAPIQSSEGSILYTVEGYQVLPGDKQRGDVPAVSRNPWMLIPGAGFE